MLYIIHFPDTDKHIESRPRRKLESDWMCALLVVPVEPHLVAGEGGEVVLQQVHVEGQLDVAQERMDIQDLQHTPSQHVLAWSNDMHTLLLCIRFYNVFVIM